MFGGGTKIKLADDIVVKATELSELLGCSLEDFVTRAVQKEIERELSKRSKREASAAEVEDIASKMKGLGYLD